jgi:hypothetical protein
MGSAATQLLYMCGHYHILKRCIIMIPNSQEEYWSLVMLRSYQDISLHTNKKKS